MSPTITCPGLCPLFSASGKRFGLAARVPRESVGRGVKRRGPIARNHSFLIGLLTWYSPTRTPRAFIFTASRRGIFKGSLPFFELFWKPAQTLKDLTKGPSALQIEISSRR
jgi:hypothetical protein